MELLCDIIVPPAMVFGGFALLFHLARLGSPEWVRRVAGGPRAWRFNLWQMMVVILASGLLLVAFGGPPGEERAFAILVLAVWILVWFARNWCNELVFLMGLRDEDLPGRNDKLIWAIVLLAMAPIGVWLFRSFRMAHWPETRFVSVNYAELHEGPGGEAATQPA
jgi:hypothetical protein